VVPEQITPFRVATVASGSMMEVSRSMVDALQMALLLLMDQVEPRLTLEALSVAMASRFPP